MTPTPRRPDESDPDRLDRKEHLFEEALRLPQARRLEFLDEQCGDDVELRAEIISLLEHADDAGEFMEALGRMTEDGGAGDPVERLNQALEGRYEISGEIGRGGMATVYLAQDVRHHRRVAVKVLRPELAAVIGAERFLAEIQTTANLQHPHILPLFDSGEADALVYYVTPFIEGESLRDLLDRENQLPLERAVAITTKVAGALQAAHDQGVIHRDIKPANILLRDGEPILSDFGIALALSAAGNERLTETGLSMGTPHYMSPEQTTAERDLDGRSDLYSLSCVLYEMLAGEPPFKAATAQAVVAQILSKDPVPLTELRRTVPQGLAAAVQRGLEKLPADRYSSVKEFGEAIGNQAAALETGRMTPGTGVPARPSGQLRAVKVGALASLVAVAAWGWLRPTGGADATAGWRFDINLPADQNLRVRTTRAFPFDLSPDGSSLVYAAIRDGVTRLYLRRFNADESVEIEGTDEARQPFFSWDGDRIGFFAAGRLRWVPVAGGAPFDVTPVVGLPAGASWGPDDVIVYSSETSDSTLTGELYRIGVSGGEPEPLELRFVSPDASDGRSAHEGQWPHHLPDGEHVLVSRGGSVFAVSLRSGEATLVLEDGVEAKYLSSGHLAYVEREQVVGVVPFDLRTLSVTGDPAPLLDQVYRGAAAGAHFFRVSRNGTAAFVQEGFQRSVVMVDRSGNEVPVSRVRRGYRWPVISPDGTEIVVSAQDGRWWSLDVATGRETPVDATGKTYFSSTGRLHSGAASSTEFVDVLSGDTVVSWGTQTFVNHWSCDDEVIIGGFIVPRTGYDVWYASEASGWERQPLLNSEFSERGGRLSPDCGWLAYASDRSGRNEVWVAPFPGLEAPERVTFDGGESPIWSPDGTEIVYRNGGRVLAVPVSATTRFELTGEPRLLFEGDYDSSQTLNWDLAPDGRFVMIKVAPGTFRQIRLIIDLEGELRDTSLRSGG